jgi:hypothetical protein
MKKLKQRQNISQHNDEIDGMEMHISIFGFIIPPPLVFYANEGG